jgi:hypothetical protein
MPGSAPSSLRQPKSAAPSTIANISLPCRLSRHTRGNGRIKWIAGRQPGRGFVRFTAHLVEKSRSGSDPENRSFLDASPTTPRRARIRRHTTPRSQSRKTKCWKVVGSEVFNASENIISINCPHPSAAYGRNQSPRRVRRGLNSVQNTVLDARKTRPNLKTKTLTLARRGDFY